MPKGSFRPTCSKEDCERPHLGRGLCVKHYYQAKRGYPKKRSQFKGTIKTTVFGYYSWAGMKQRVNDPNVKHYEHYGGRGITACQAIYKSFDYFLEIVGPRPQGKTLDRTDNDKGYWCGKCTECRAKGQELNMRWATYKEQSMNRRNTRKVLA